MDKLKTEYSSFDEVVIGLMSALKQKATVEKQHGRLQEAFSAGNFSNQDAIVDLINDSATQLMACQVNVDHQKHLLKHKIYTERMPREEGGLLTDHLPRPL